MIAHVPIFIILCHYSTVLLSIFITLCCRFLQLTTHYKCVHCKVIFLMDTLVYRVPPVVTDVLSNKIN